jgi:replicative DNA helicase
MKEKPNAKDIEEIVVGSLLIDDRSVPVALELLKSEVFYAESCREVFEAVRQLSIRGIAVDLVTVSEELRKRGTLERCGGEFALVQTTQKVSSAAHIEYHCRILIQEFIKREAIEVAEKLEKKARKPETDSLELLEDAYAQLNKVAETTTRKQESRLGDIISAQITKGVEIFQGKSTPGISTPFHFVNEKTGGWKKGELIILAARPGMGKTAFALACGIHAASNGHPTAFISLEMSKEQLTNRILASEGEINTKSLTVQGLSPEEEKKANEIKERLEKIPFFIDDTATTSIEQLQIMAKRLKHKIKMELLIVDYLQLISSEKRNANREQEISKISRGLKLLAKDLDIPVIALSQLSRAVETRGGDKRPMLSDLRDSGAIEQDADIVTFLYRPESYGIRDWGNEYSGKSTVDEAEYMVAKNRNGALTRNRVKFLKRYTRFCDINTKNDYCIAEDDEEFFNELENKDKVPF